MHQSETVDLHSRLEGPPGAPVILLSHALGASLAMWDVQADAFAGQFRVLRFDTRGHGASPVPPAPYTLPELGGDVLRLMDARRIEQAHFCGLSMGGCIGMWLAAHAPDRIDRLVLCNTMTVFDPPGGLDARIATVRREGMSPLVDGTLERWFTSSYRAQAPEAVAAIRALLLAAPVEGYVGCAAALRDMDLRGDLGRIRTRTLVICGSQDATSPPAAARVMAAGIAEARCLELPSAHLSNLNAAAAFNAAVMGFLQA